MPRRQRTRAGSTPGQRKTKWQGSPRRPAGVYGEDLPCHGRNRGSTPRTRSTNLLSSVAERPPCKRLVRRSIRQGGSRVGVSFNGRTPALHAGNAGSIPVASTIMSKEGAAEWSATSLENWGGSRARRSIRPPSAKNASVGEWLKPAACKAAPKGSLVRESSPAHQSHGKQSTDKLK